MTLRRRGRVRSPCFTLALALAPLACAGAHGRLVASAPPTEGSTPAQEEVEPSAQEGPVEPPVLVNPVDRPCPPQGWATAAALLGGWSTSFYSRQAGRSARIGERHDYLADGVVLGVRIVRRPPSPSELEAMTSGKWIGLLPRPEEREDWIGTWNVDDSGVRELRLRHGDRTRVTRERVWIAVNGLPRTIPTLYVRTLRRDDDGVWRGDVFFEEARPGVTRGYESRVELRFDPALDPNPPGRGDVDVRRTLRVWSGARPVTWKTRTRGTYTVEQGRVALDLPRQRLPPEDDARLWEAFDVFYLDTLRPAETGVLLNDSYAAPYPRWFGRNTDPPILWYDILDHGFCTKSQRESVAP